MTTAASSMTAEELGHRVLNLIDSIRSKDDMSPENIEKVIGVKVEFNPKNHNDYGFGGKLTDQWSYNFGSLKDLDGGKPRRLELSFDKQTEATIDLTPICKLNYEGYSKFLTDAGFSKSPFHAEHGRLSSVNFVRGQVAVDINPIGDGKHTCVSILTIEVMPTEEGRS